MFCTLILKFSSYSEGYQLDISKTEATGMLVGVVIFLVLMSVVAILATYARNKDNDKPLATERGLILEKTKGELNTEYFLVEFETGERKRLQSFPVGSVYAAVGERGVIGYKGDTIVTFTRNGGAREEKSDWCCSYCENINPSHVVKCLKCGEAKTNDAQIMSVMRNTRAVGANEWHCPTCGRINQNYVGTCGCGTQKP